MCIRAYALDTEVQEVPAAAQTQNAFAENTVQQEKFEESNITTKPVTAEIDRASVKSPYENDIKTSVADHSKNEMARMIFMFLKVMVAVAVSSVIIYFLLILVRNFYGIKPSNSNIKLEDNLKSTQNENEALKIFLNRTKNL
jgi:hypothetical protein